jgi:hypothetical protein
MPRGILLTSNLPQLQNLIKRDPEAYREEFLQQWNRYNTIRQIFHLNPEQEANNFRELVSFISQVLAFPSFPKPTRTYLMIFSSLPNVTRKKLQSFLPNYLLYSLKTTKSCPQISAGPLSRIWSCFGPKMSYLPYRNLPPLASHPPFFDQVHLGCCKLFSHCSPGRHPRPCER